jgi:hypothetical protein
MMVNETRVCRQDQQARAAGDSVEGTRAVRVQLECGWTGGLIEEDKTREDSGQREKVRDLAKGKQLF